MVKRITVLFLIFQFYGFSQTGWFSRVDDDPFDGKTFYAFSLGYGGESPYSNPTFVLRYTEKNNLEAYIRDLGYSGCDDNKIEIAFNNSSDNIEVFNVNESKNRDAVFFKTGDIKRLIDGLKKYSTTTIRFSNSCSQKRFKVSLRGSTKAINELLDKVEDNDKKLSEKLAIDLQKRKEDFIEIEKKLRDDLKGLPIDLTEEEINKNVKRISDDYLITLKSGKYTTLLLKRHEIIDDWFELEFYDDMGKIIYRNSFLKKGYSKVDNIIKNGGYIELFNKYNLPKIALDGIRMDLKVALDKNNIKEIDSVTIYKNAAYRLIIGLYNKGEFLYNVTSILPSSTLKNIKEFEYY